MLRKISIVPILLAMLMVTLTTVIPHHHHQTMICIVEEACEHDGCGCHEDCCCHDMHSHHSAGTHDEDESNCVAHEKYTPSENLVLEGAEFTGMVPDIFPILALLAEATASQSQVTGFALGDFIPIIPPPPPLSLAAPNAPPSIA